MVVIVASAGYTGVALAANQFESAIPQSGDLCDGAGGRGQIVSVGNDSLTIKRYDNGSNQIVYLSGQATIETSAGFVSLSYLKIGESVTLVGGTNPDRSFTADTVMVCGGTQKNGISTTTPTVLRNNNAKYEKVNGAINAGTYLIVGLIWLGIVGFLTLKKRKGLVYLLFFTIFYIYLYKVFDYALIRFQSLLLIRHFVPDLMLSGVKAGRALNLIPLATLGLADVRTSLLNILMMMPFGFGLPFITNFRFKKIVIAGLLVSIVIEFLQFVTGFISNTTFRIADINDVIFNTLGVAIGYILFVQFIRIYRRILGNRMTLANPVLRYIADRPQVES